MDSELRSVRYELKMICDQALLPTTQSWTRLHSAGFHETFPPRQVNNIYFDTYNLDTYNDHVDSASERRKLRFRWYGEDLTRAEGQFEIKEKNERVGWKLVQQVKTMLELENCDWSEAQWAMRNDLREAQNGLFLEMLQVSRPLVLNCYRREYYETANGQVRLTLDYDLRAYDQWMAARPNLTFCVPTLDRMVIELKCDVRYAGYLADVLAEFPLRVNRNSKYISALDPLVGR
jgi:SPX domain protein involved in polyphosphate accumulation